MLWCLNFTSMKKKKNLAHGSQLILMQSKSLGVDPRNLNYLKAAQVILMASRSRMCFSGGLLGLGRARGELGQLVPSVPGRS